MTDAYDSEWAESIHPREGDLYTPYGPRFLLLLDYCHAHMEFWRIVAWKSGFRLKVLRNLRSGKYKTVSLTTVDKLIVGCNVNEMAVDDFVWFTAQDLVRIGVWRETIRVAGEKRYYGGAIWRVDAEERKRRKAIRMRLRRKQLRALKQMNKLRPNNDRVDWIAIWQKEKYFPFR